MRLGSGRWAGTVGLGLLAFAAGCAGGREESKEGGEGQEAAEAALSAYELENGIGPVKESVILGAIDNTLAAKGKVVFELKCTACHKLDTLYIGPALGEVATRRTGAYVMNMVLNPQEMVERHPVAKQLLAERMTFIANQGLTVEEARAVLEYLRTQSKHAPKR